MNSLIEYRINTKQACNWHGVLKYVVSIVLLSVQGSAMALDRSTALAVINNSEYYPRYETLTPLPLGKPVNINIVVQTLMKEDKRLGKAIDTGYACGKKLGFLSIRGDKKVVFGTDMGTFYHVTTTAKGLKSGWVVNENLYGYKQGYVMPIYKKEAARVLRIKTPDSTTAIVDIETGLTEVLPAGYCVFPGIDNQRDKVVGKHRVTLGLYDDGWQVEDAKAKGDRVDWVDIEPASKFKVSKASTSSRQTKSKAVNGSSTAGVASSQSASGNARHASLDKSSIVLIQQKLTELGYEPGVADGVPGSKTRSAISAYQRKQGVEEDGEPSQQVLSMLTSNTENFNTESTNENAGDIIGNFFKKILVKD